MSGGGAARASIEDIVEAYKQTGSVWKAARQLGISGQSVWERLKIIDYPLAKRVWTSEELEELRALVSHCTLSEVAQRLGRTYYAVAMKASRLGIAERAGSRMKRKVPRGSGLNKQTVKHFAKELRAFDGSLRKFCTTRGLHVTTLSNALHNYEPEFWAEYTRAKGLEALVCPGCEQLFYPSTKKQKACSSRCVGRAKRDAEYFGGRRMDAVGMRDGVCQLCFQPKPKGLSAHHVYGKENDPENSVMVALCVGCHKIVGDLMARKFAATKDGWERLISVCMIGRKGPEWGEGQQNVGVHVMVDIEYLEADEVEDMLAAAECSMVSGELNTVAAKAS